MSKFSSVHHWPVDICTSFEQLLQWLLLLVEGLPKFEGPPLHFTVGGLGGPLHPPGEFVPTLGPLLCVVGPQTYRGANCIDQQLFCLDYDASHLLQPSHKIASWRLLTIFLHVIHRYAIGQCMLILFNLFVTTFLFNTVENKKGKVTPTLRAILIGCCCQETCRPLTLFKLINNITKKITHIPCACERCIFNHLNKLLTQKLQILCHNSLGTNRPEGWLRTDL